MGIAHGRIENGLQKMWLQTSAFLLLYYCACMKYSISQRRGQGLFILGGRAGLVTVVAPV